MQGLKKMKLCSRNLMRWLPALLAMITAPMVQADHKMPNQSVLGHHSHHSDVVEVASEPEVVTTTTAKTVDSSKQLNTLTVSTPLTIFRPLPGKNMTAAYPIISNTTGNQRTLLSVSADWAEKIEIHTHERQLGIMRMRQIDELIIEPGSQQVFQPGGLHLMVFGVQQPLPDQPTMTFCYDQQECLTVIGKVEDY